MTPASPYTVERIDVDIEAIELRTAGLPPEEFDTMLDLPDDLPGRVSELADQVAEGATSAYDRAAALQRFFRPDGGFELHPRDRARHSSSALVDFLDNRQGYCEQYAAAMAVWPAP